MAKQGSYAIHVGSLYAVGSQRIVDLHLAARDFPDLPVEIFPALRLQALQSTREPALQTGADRGKLPLDGGLREIVR
jgi:hypothetical protein